MTLNFINPVYLWGFLGLSLPLLIHLLTRRQQTRIRFSAVHLLEQAQKRSVRRSQPNKLLLLLLRCLALACLCLALANPLFSFADQNALLPSQPTSTVLILDDSYSMRAGGGESSLFQQARETLAALVTSAPSNQHFSLVLAADPPRALSGWNDDREQLAKTLRASQASFQTTGIGQAFETAVDLLADAPSTQKRILLLTDLDENGWRADEFPSMEGQGASVRILDFSGQQASPNQAAVESVQVSQEFLTHSRMIRVRYRVKNLQAGRALNGLTASLWIDGKQQAQETLALGPGASLEKEFTFPHLGKDRLNGYVKLAADGLLEDNRRFFTYQPDQRLRILLVDGDPRGVSHQNEIFYIERAMNPFSRSVSDIEPVVSTPAELPNRDLSRFSALVLCNVRTLPFGYEEQIERFVSQGGALLVTLGDQVDVKAYNEKLGGLLPVTLRTLNQVNETETPFRLKAATEGHPALSVFSGKMLAEMEHVRIHSFFSVEAKPDRSFLVPMQLTNEAPLLVESDFGKGKVLLYTTSIDRDWNNFPIQPMFLPWVQRWVKYMSQSLDTITRRDLNVLEAIELGEIDGDWWVESPDGQVSRIAPQEDGVPVFSESRIPGVYALFTTPTQAGSEDNKANPAGLKLPPNAHPAGGFTVNVDTRESIPDKIGEAAVHDILRGAPVEISRQTETLQTVKTDGGFSMVMPFLLAMAVMMCAEGWLVRKE